MLKYWTCFSVHSVGFILILPRWPLATASLSFLGRRKPQQFNCLPGSTALSLCPNLVRPMAQPRLTIQPSVRWTIQWLFCRQQWPIWGLMHTFSTVSSLSHFMSVFKSKCPVFHTMTSILHLSKVLAKSWSTQGFLGQLWLQSEALPQK